MDLKGKLMTITYPDDIYPKEVLIKASYRFLDRAYIHIDKDHDKFVVSLTAKDDMEPVTAEEFDNEMLAQAARYVISARTKNIREITLARAMASTIIEEDIAYNETEDVEDVSSILKDWFENE